MTKAKQPMHHYQLWVEKLWFDEDGFMTCTEPITRAVFCKNCKRYYKNNQTADQCRYSGRDDGYCFMAEAKE